MRREEREGKAGAEEGKTDLLCMRRPSATKKVLYLRQWCLVTYKRCNTRELSKVPPRTGELGRAFVRLGGVTEYIQWYLLPPTSVAGAIGNCSSPPCGWDADAEGAPMEGAIA